MIIFNSIMLVSSIIQMSLGKGDVLHHLVRLKPRVTFEYTQVMIFKEQFTLLGFRSLVYDVITHFKFIYP